MHVVKHTIARYATCENMLYMEKLGFGKRSFIHKYKRERCQLYSEGIFSVFSLQFVVNLILYRSFLTFSWLYCLSLLSRALNEQAHGLAKFCFSSRQDGDLKWAFSILLTRG